MLKKKRIRVFRLNDYDWWAGETLAQVKKDYLKETGMDEEEAFDEPKALTKEEMKKYTIREEDGTQERTFEEELKAMIKAKVDFPCMFASTEC